MPATSPATAWGTGQAAGLSKGVKIWERREKNYEREGRFYWMGTMGQPMAGRILVVVFL